MQIGVRPGCSATDRRIDSKFRELLPRRGRDCEGIGSAKLRLESWIQNRIQLAPITPNTPKEWCLAERRINSIRLEVEITNQPLYQLS